MQAYKLPNGNLLIPFIAEAPGKALGDGMVEVSPGSSDYKRWLPFAVEKKKSSKKK